jgi:hypothetical protein
MFRMLTVIACVVAGFMMCLPVRAADATVDEYAVYTAYLSARVGDVSKRRFVIAAETADGAANTPHGEFDGAQLRKSFSDPASRARTSGAPEVIDDDLMESFRRVRTETVRLNPFRLNVPSANVVSAVEMEAFFEVNGTLDETWRTFNARFGAEYLTLSRIGFNRERSRALFAFAFSCGPLCGGGQYVLMVKRGRRWQKAAEVMTWVS